LNSIDIKRRLAILEAQLFEAIDNIENVSDEDLLETVKAIRVHRDRLARGDHGKDSPVRCAICRELIEPRDVVFKRESNEALFESCHPMCEFTTCGGMIPPRVVVDDENVSPREKLERQLAEAEFECRYAMDEDRDAAANWRDSLKRQLDELKRIEDEEVPCDLIRDKDGNLVNARGFLDDDGNVIDD
jgi:hypothetical protein